MTGVIISTDISSRSIVTIAEEDMIGTVDMTGAVTDAAAMDGEGEAEVVTATAAVIGNRQ